MLSHPLLEGLLGDEAAQRVFGDARQAYVTILARSGPHSTPEVHFAWGGRIWVMVGNDTVKAKVLRERPETGVLARAGARAVVVAGESRLLDPTRPTDVLHSPSEAMLSGVAMAGYLGRNQHDLLGFVEDALGQRLGVELPAAPLLLAVRPRAVAVLDGTSVVAAEGEWPGRRGRETFEERGSEAEDGGGRLPNVPTDAAQLLEHERDCVVGWDSRLGPLGLPGRWDPRRHVAAVPSELFTLAELQRHSQACVTLDASEEHDSVGKHGVVLRGAAVAAPAGELVEVRVDARRATWWRGKQTGTETVA